MVCSITCDIQIENKQIGQVRLFTWLRRSSATVPTRVSPRFQPITDTSITIESRSKPDASARESSSAAPLCMIKVNPVPIASAKPVIEAMKECTERSSENAATRLPTAAIRKRTVAAHGRLMIEIE